MSNGRFSSFFGDEQILGSYVARLSPLGFIFISSIEDEKFKKLFFLFLHFINKLFNFIKW